VRTVAWSFVCKEDIRRGLDDICDVIAEQWVQFWCRNAGVSSGTFASSGVCHWLAALLSEAQMSKDDVSAWPFAIAQLFDLCGECDQR